MMARMAAAAGFKAGYLSGGSLGWYKCVTEANITLPEMAQVCVDIRAASTCRSCSTPAAAGAIRSTCTAPSRSSQSAGFAAIEIEDQVLPRRVEHHLGREHLVPTEFMVERVKEAVAARTDPNMLIIARTNAVRPYGLDDALRRGEAFKKAGADMLFIWSRNAEELRKIGERLPPPLMMFAPPDGFNGFPLSQAELAKLGYRLAASSGSALAAIVKAVRQNYEALAKGEIDPLLGKGGVEPEMKAAQRITGLDELVAIEKRTMKD